MVFFKEISYSKLNRIIWPPERHTELYLSPRLSPNYRQSQADYDYPDYERYPGFSFDNPYEVLFFFNLKNNN